MSEKRIFTIDEVAKICKVANRTVCKWFDSGRLRGYRIPGTQARKIPRDNLEQFMKAHGMPLEEIELQSPPSPSLEAGGEKPTDARLDDLLILQHEFTGAEWDALRSLSEKQELTRTQTLRQALRMYQAVVLGHLKLVEVNPLSNRTCEPHSRC